MAFSKLEKAMAVLIGLDIIKPGVSRGVAKEAVKLIARQGISAASVGATGVGVLGRAAVSAGGAPLALGAATGLGILGSPEGQQLLDAAAVRGAEDRLRFNQALATLDEKTKPTRRKTKSAFNKAVAKGMSVAKASTSYGPKGQINNAKKAFTLVTKTASGLKKGGKVAKTGIKRKIGLAIRKIL